MPILRIKFADRSEVTHELLAERITIGRRPENLIQIMDPSVSAHHAELIAEGGHYRLRDLGSTNLSLVNGVPVTDFHLHDPCQIAFGTVRCEFDPVAGAGSSGLSVTQLERDLTFVRGENADLRGKITALQRQIDILNSARLVTHRADHTPFAAANDTLKGIVAERDDVRHQAAALKRELENMREELEATARERDAARQALENVQALAQALAQAREMQERSRPHTAPAADRPSASKPAAAQESSLGVPAPVAVLAAPAVPAFATSSASAYAFPNSTDSATTQRVMLPPPAEFQPVAAALPHVCQALDRFGANPGDQKILAAAVDGLAGAAVRLGDHPIARLAMAMENFLQDLGSRPESPGTTHLRTLRQAAELMGRLLDPRCLERAKTLAHPKVLAVDDDADLLHTVAASFELAQLPTTTCADGHNAQILLEKNSFDLLLLDMNLPDFDGPALCNRIRQIEQHRNTPVIFLTGTNTLDQRAQASLSGGNDFLAKPFNLAELTVKAETLIWRKQLGLL